MNRTITLKRWQYIAGYLVLVVAFVFAIYRVETLSRQNYDTLCAMKTNAESQLEMLVSFINDHPNGVAGITRADLDASLQRQGTFVAAFRDTECD